MIDLNVDCTVICENLQSSDRLSRQKTLKELEEIFNNEEIQPEKIQFTYEQSYLYILKCYYDKFENCRELACNVVTAALTRLPKNDYYLQYVISTIASRIGKKEIIETSEELRLLLLQQLNFLIVKYGNDVNDKDSRNKEDIDLLLRSYNDILDILLKTLTDSYPAVLNEACSCIKTFASNSKLFHYRAQLLAKPVFPLLHHKHSVTRIAAIESLGIICLHVNSKSDFTIQLMQEISPLLMDPMPLVRMECGKVGCNWLLNFMDRYSYFERILPLVLCCLKDDSPDVRANIGVQWKICGKQFFDENESELNTLQVIDEKPLNYPENVERPTLGCRALVQRSLRMVKLIMRESSDWKIEVRLHSFKLMYQFVLHAEKKLTAFFFEIFSDLAKGCDDNEKVVSTEALKVCDLMGRLLLYNDWINHGIENLEKHRKLGYLKCFYSIYSASCGNNIDHILRICEIISRSEFSHTFKPEFQLYLIKLSEILWKRSQSSVLENGTDDSELSPEIEEIQQCLYHVVIKVMALSFENENNPDGVHEMGKNFLTILANHHSVKFLHGKHLRSVLDTFDNLDTDNDDNSEPILLLHGVIRICGFNKNYIDVMEECIKNTWRYALPNAKVKIFSAISIVMLDWDEIIDLEGEENEKVLDKFVENIIIPHIKWKAGASAESMRSFAAATLCSMTQGSKLNAPKILPKYSSLFPNIIEDNSSSTRLYALKCFLNFGKTSIENLKSIGYVILQRLDDPVADVRDWAARVIAMITPEETDVDNSDIWNNLINHAFAMLFIHFDGPELKLRETVKESLITLGRQYPKNFDTKFREAINNFTNVQELIALQKMIVD